MEKEAGLERLIRSPASVACTGRLAPAKYQPSGNAMAGLRPLTRVLGSITDDDIYAFDSILVTTGLNLNDDYFDRLEVWTARGTPEQKQVNVEHRDSKVVGHVISCSAVGADLSPITTEAVDDLPDMFHLLTSGVLYKQWRTPELQEEMDELLSAVAERKLFVSMECHFNAFDYLLTAANGSTRTVARTDKTAFLTKHLRAYGGKGVFGNEKVARVLRNITFSGSAVVARPANPESIILTPGAEPKQESTHNGVSRVTNNQKPRGIPAGRDGRAMTAAELDKARNAIASYLTWSEPKSERSSDVKRDVAKFFADGWRG